MLFNSYLFILLFLPVTLAGYFLCGRLAGRGPAKHEPSGRGPACHMLAKVWLLAASFVFYGYVNPPYVLALAATILVNYGLSAKLLSVRKRAKAWLVFALALNLGALFLFKYYNFFIGNINRAFASDFNLLHLAMPLGISFITFQQIAFVVDSYRKEIPRYKFLDYAVFVAFFPKLISGPIALHTDLIPQFEDRSRLRFNSDNFAKGLYAFSFGLAKKMILAGAFGGAAAYGFDVDVSLTATTAVLTILAYTFQIYFDFSGYCDMATGIGWMFNIRIPMNFNSPYRAVNINDFWKRWHMTLTGFLTKYLYIPLGGNRKGRARTYVNCMIVFLLSGFWHGAAWTFIVWGGLHGAFTVIYRAGRKFFDRLPKWLMWAVTFGFVNAAWVYFRAGWVWQANGILKRALTGGITGVPAELSGKFLLPEFNFILTPLLSALGDPISAGLLCLGLFYAFAFFAVLVMKNTNERIEHFVPTGRKAVVCVLLLFWSVASLTQASSFVYFNF